MAAPKVKVDTSLIANDISEVFEKFGIYQFVQFFLLCIPVFVITMVNLNYIFVAGELRYRCKVPECESSNISFEASWWPASVDHCSRPLLRADEDLDTPCTNNSFSGQVEPCHEWVYENDNTVIATLNLACRPWLSNLIGTVHSAGMLVSMTVGGFLSDRLGRKPTLIFCAVSSCIGLIKTFVTSYYLYISIEFCEAVVTASCYTAAMMLMLEICGKQNRAIAGVLFSFSSTIAECLFAVIGMFVPYWKHLIYIINSPSLLFLTYKYFIRESPRWLIVSGNTKKAKKALIQIAEANKINIDKQYLLELDDIDLKSHFKINNFEKKERLVVILRSREILKRVFVAAVCRFSVSLVSYGLMINSVLLPGNKHTNFLLLTATSLPTDLITLYLLNKIGRKKPLFYGFITSGILCVATGFVPKSYIWTKVVLFLSGKFMISICFSGIIAYTMELFPTSVRGSLLGFEAFISRVAGLIAPLTPLLNEISEALPSVVFGCSALLAGSLLTLTPETRDLPLMDTIHQVEESVRIVKEEELLMQQREP